MKKRFICLLLSAIMVLLCLAGCAEDTREEVMAEIGEKASDGAQTIAMYLMAEAPVSEYQEKLVEEKVNEITKARFNIKVDLKYFTPDTYYTQLEANLAKSKEFYEGGAVGKVTDNPVYVDENGLPAVYYPSIEEFDVDIFYFGGYDKYRQYLEAGYLNDLNEELKSSSKALKAVINNTLLSSFIEANNSGTSKSVYAIPTNRTIGEYTYILLNRDALDKTAYAPKDIVSLTDANCQDMLAQIATDHREQFVPLYSELSCLELMNDHYFASDSIGMLNGEFSLLAGSYNANATDLINPNPDITDIFGAGLNTQIDVLKEYEFKDYYKQEEEAEKPFAVGYIKGTPVDIERYTDDYEVVIAEYPTLKTSDLYESMFSVNKYTNDLASSAKILTFLNTDVDFRNLILYGVEGENYVWVDSEITDDNGAPYRVVSRQTSDPNRVYLMDALKTGNVALAYSSDSDNPKYNANIFDHNAELKVDPILGFSFYDALKSEGIAPEVMTAYSNVAAASKTFADRIISATNETEMAAIWTDVIAYNTSVDMTTVVAGRDRSAKTPIACYLNWLVSKGKWEPPK